MDRRVLELWRSELPIQLAPMGGASASPRLALAVAAAGGHAMYPALGLPPPALAPASGRSPSAAPRSASTSSSR